MTAMVMDVRELTGEELEFVSGGVVNPPEDSSDMTGAKRKPGEPIYFSIQL